MTKRKIGNVHLRGDLIELESPDLFSNLERAWIEHRTRRH